MRVKLPIGISDFEKIRREGYYFVDDTADSQPERVYHMFVLGLLVSLTSRYEIHSNRESGFGRYDIMMRPKLKKDPGIIMAFKTFEGEDPTSALTAAKDQMRTRQYAMELLDAGVSRVHELAIACNGKRVFVEAGYSAAE